MPASALHAAASVAIAVAAAFVPNLRRFGFERWTMRALSRGRISLAAFTPSLAIHLESCAQNTYLFRRLACGSLVLVVEEVLSQTTIQMLTQVLLDNNALGCD